MTLTVGPLPSLVLMISLFLDNGKFSFGVSCLAIFINFLAFCVEERIGNGVLMLGSRWASCVKLLEAVVGWISCYNHCFQ